MAIEMLAGKTGERLIARQPISDGSYAEVGLITLNGAGLVRLTDAGGYQNGYPALTPELGSVDSVDTEIRRYVERVMNVNRVETAAARSVLDKLIEKSQEDSYEGLVAELASIGLEDSVDRMEYFLRKPPICPRVMPGHVMQMALPKFLFPRENIIDLGVVTSIEIYNTDAAEQPAQTV